MKAMKTIRRVVSCVLMGASPLAIGVVWSVNFNIELSVLGIVAVTGFLTGLYIVGVKLMD